MDDQLRDRISDSLEKLAAQDEWNSIVWQSCHDLILANIDLDPLLGYVYDDLIHYTGRQLFSRTPKSSDLNQYRQDFRDIALALRRHMTIADFKNQHE